MRDSVSGNHIHKIYHGVDPWENNRGDYLQFIVYICIRRVPDFVARFCPVFGQEKDKFLATAVRALFDKNSYNQFYIRPCVQIIYDLPCFFFKLP